MNKMIDKITRIIAGLALVAGVYISIHNSMPVSTEISRVNKSTGVLELVDADGDVVGRGTGVMLNSGYVITAQHVLDSEAYTSLKFKNNLCHMDTIDMGLEDIDVAFVVCEGREAGVDVCQYWQTLGPDEYMTLGYPRGLRTVQYGRIVSTLQVERSTINTVYSFATTPGASGSGIYRMTGEYPAFEEYCLVDLVVAVTWDNQIPTANMIGVGNIALMHEIDNKFSNRKLLEHRRAE